MTSFWLAAAALIALASWMLKPAAAGHRPSASSSNLGLMKAEWMQLDADLAAGRLGIEEHRAARDELQRRVLSEAPGNTTSTHPGHASKTWLLASLIVPLFALLLYGSLGNLAALNPPPSVVATRAATPTATSAGSPQPDPLATMVDTLAQRLAAEPELAKDVSAWTMLARAYAGLQRFPEASAAYARAIALTPDDVQLLADRADVLAMLQGGRMAGEPQQLIDRALALDGNNLKALALAGSAAFERQDKAAAIAYWQRARQQAPAGSAFATSIDRSLAAAQSPSTSNPSAAATAPASPPATAATAAAQISGRATLAPALASRIAPDDTVFVTARAIDGPRMPLAVLRRKAADLPFDFRLDDSMAMAPSARLSSYPKVVLSVRVSRSGQALPQSGDLFGQAEADAGSGQPVAITVDAVQP